MPLNVQVGRWSDVLRKRMGVQAHVGLNLVDDMFLTYPTHPAPPEDLLLRDEFRLGSVIAVPAVAAQYGFWRISNPVGSNRIVVLERVQWQSTAVLYMGWENAAVGPSSNLTAYQLDGRAFNVRHNVAGIALGTAAAVGIANNQLASFSAAPLDCDVVIMPGQCWAGWAQTVNTNITVALRWREFTPGDEEMRG